MPRSPEAARVGRKIDQIMYDKRITRTALAERIGRLTGERPGPMYVARRVKGDIHLTTVRRVAEYGPNAELMEIARALAASEDGTVDETAAAMLADELAAAALEPEAIAS